MRIECQWQDNMAFNASAAGHTVAMDAKRPIGNQSGMTPKELVVAGLCGCTAMDVVGLLKKHKVTLRECNVSADVATTTGIQPAVFTAIDLSFRAVGDVSPDVLLEAVMLSQTKFCGVSAMLSKAMPIRYSVELNGEVIGKGEARF